MLGLFGGNSCVRLYFPMRIIRCFESNCVALYYFHRISSKKISVLTKTVNNLEFLKQLLLSLLGNGPSGICLSYLLSGYRPYLSPEAVHPNPILHTKLEEARHLSIVDQVSFCCHLVRIFLFYKLDYETVVFL